VESDPRKRVGGKRGSVPLSQACSSIKEGLFEFRGDIRALAQSIHTVREGSVPLPLAGFGCGGVGVGGGGGGGALGVR